MPTLKELSVLYAKKQPKQVDAITFEAPILGMIPFEEASHDMWNITEVIKEVTGAGFVDQDAELPTVGAKSELKKVDLSIMGGKAYVGEDKARQFGGAPAYFAKHQDKILRQSGMAAEKAILYNTLKPYALANGKKINAGGSAGKNYTIIAVRFIPGETTGLYSPKGFDGGSLLNVTPLANGSLHEFEETRNGVVQKVLGYGVRYKGYLGMQAANEDSVAILANIDRDSATKKLPTQTMMDDLLDMVQAGPNTYLFMHPSCKSALKSLKTTSMQTLVGDKNIITSFDAWDGIPIVTSFNFVKGTEANVTF